MKLSLLLLLCVFCLHGWAQLSNPIPERIEFGELTLELEPYVTIPASNSGAPKARLSIMRALPDGRKFVNDLQGYLYHFDTGRSTLYLNLKAVKTAFIDGPGLGTGFQSFAFHPEFATNGIFYTTHTEPANANGGQVDFRAPNSPNGGLQAVVTEWSASNPDALVFSGTSREVVRFHFAGNVHGIQEIAFNPNAVSGDEDYGLLYICLGEGGEYLSGRANATHRLDSFLGSVFRIDPLGNNSGNGAYGIPVTNPWATISDESVIKEIYAYGFRNPHRIIWDTGGEHKLYLGDIGERNIEEINHIIPGADYGFPEREGTFVLNPDKPSQNGEIFNLPPDDAQNGYTYPVAQFDHDEGFAIALGAVYRGTKIRGLDGVFLFGDIKSGRIFYLNEADLIDGEQATIKEARLKLSGVSGTMTSFVGNSRADIRFGTDAEGEIYILTKADGKIRKLVGIEKAASRGHVVSNPANWILSDNFENGSKASTIVNTGVEGVIVSEADPFADAENTVKKLNAKGSVLRMPISINPQLESNAVYFRFALAESSSEILLGLSNIALAFSSNDAQVVLSAKGTGSLTVSEGSGAVEIADNLRTGIWYECWITFPEGKNQFNVYLRGDTYTSAALLHTEGIPKSPLSALNSAIVESETMGFIYVDDIYYDPGAVNLSSAVGGSWQLVSDFESDQSFDQWVIRDTNPLDASSDDYVQWLIEPSGNSYLRMAAMPVSSRLTISYIPLPFQVEVSDVVTLFGRFRANSLKTNQNFGLSDIAFGNDIFSIGYNSFEAQMRIIESIPIDVRNSGSFQPISSVARNAFSAGVWWEYWMVIDNGGQASGGQTFDLYMRPDSSNELPQLVATSVDFRIARELPLRYFLLIAGSGTTAPGAVDYDDLYISPGVVLDRPHGTGIGLFPGAAGGKESPWFGYLWDKQAPWIYHTTHQWIYVPSDQYSDVWYFDSDLGWVFTRPELYPYIYDQSALEWLFYQRESSAPRWFYGFNRKAWLSLD